MKRLLMLALLLVILFTFSVKAGYLTLPQQGDLFPTRSNSSSSPVMVSSEQAVVRAVEQALPSVVTVSIGKDVTTQS
ncbi:MAG: hypothetical protein NUV52_03860, partial [Candidatus Roizmanbacteria bacterium]|nr:hypothetical protein [Candidatus Roizmanbacteria bacterium]